MSKIGIRFYGESRENFNELEVATRQDDRLGKFVELVDAQGFRGNDTVEQILVKVSTRPGPTPTRNIVSLEMLSELFKIFGHFPSVRTPGSVEMFVHNISQEMLRIRQELKKLKEIQATAAVFHSVCAIEDRCDEIELMCKNASK